MKLKLVGTGAITGLDRSACSLIDSKILIDCGNGLLKTLTAQGVEIMNIEAVFITHLHADHFFDLPFLMLLRFINKANNFLKIYCPKGTEEIIKHLCDDYVAGKPESYNLWKEKGNFEFVEFESLNEKEILDNYYVTSFEVCHGVMRPSYGYVVKYNDKVVGFSGDTTYCSAVEEIVNTSNVAVLDMAFVETTPVHMGVYDIENICKNNRDKTIVATHMSGKAREVASSKNIKNLVVATDGMELEI